jgi:hypothetical protein
MSTALTARGRTLKRSRPAPMSSPRLLRDRHAFRPSVRPRAIPARWLYYRVGTEQCSSPCSDRYRWVSCITVPVGRPLWKDIPIWFLVAEDDRMIVPETQRYMAGRR